MGAKKKCNKDLFIYFVHKATQQEQCVVTYRAAR